MNAPRLRMQLTGARMTRFSGLTGDELDEVIAMMVQEVEKWETLQGVADDHLNQGIAAGAISSAFAEWEAAVDEKLRRARYPCP